MLGSDSAPHPLHAKECCGCAAGVFTSPVLLERTVELFEQHGALDKVQAFVSDNARRWHPSLETLLPQRKITLKKSAWKVPENYADSSGKISVVPYEAGKMLAWQVC
jgi:dihydroorotase